MFSKIWAVLGIARNALALAILTGATTALVAGSYDAEPGKHAKPNPTEIEVLTRMCLATQDPASETCAKAIEASGLAPDAFWARVAMSLSDQVHKQKKDERPSETPKADDHNVNTGELLGLVNACVASHERSSEPCARALELSGLPANEFWAKVGAMLGKPTSSEQPKPSASPKPATSEEVYALIKECQAAYERARQTHEGGDAVSQICNKAIDATGLSANDFWSKFAPKPATTEQPKPSATPKPATTPTAKPTQSVSDADLQILVKDCFTKYAAATASKGNEDLGRAAYEACTKAVAASGLSGDAFFAKFGKPAAPTN